jgi:hypothetical protein
MLMAAPIVLGIFSYFRLGVDLFPDVDIPVVIISTTLRGASVEEMETKKANGHVLHITPKLREAILKGLPAFKLGGDVGYDRGGSIIRRALDVVSRLPQ